MGIIREYLTFAGKDSRDFNVWISGGGTYDAPIRDVTTVSVPGRNGDLTLDNGRFKNIEVEYPAFISKDLPNNFAGFREFMKSKTGYQRIEDTYHLDEYRMGILVDDFGLQTTARNRAGNFYITFNCKPQRFLKSGERFLPTMTASGTIYNPTLYEAKPIIRVVGTGYFTINNVRVEVDANTVYTDIDSELEDCYYGLNLLNANIAMIPDKFPVLVPGSNGIDIGTVTSIQIMPRWWTI